MSGDRSLHVCIYVCLCTSVTIQYKQWAAHSGSIFFMHSGDLFCTLLSRDETGYHCRQSREWSRLKYVCSTTDLSCTILSLPAPLSPYLCLQLYPLLSFPLLSPSHSCPVSLLLHSSTSLSLLPSSCHAMPCLSSLHHLLLPCHRDVIWRELSGLLSFSTSSTSSCT